MNNAPNVDRQALITITLAAAIDLYAAQDTEVMDTENNMPICAVQGAGFIVAACIGKEAVERYLRRFFEASKVKMPAAKTEEFIQLIMNAPQHYPYAFNRLQLLELTSHAVHN